MGNHPREAAAPQIASDASFTDRVATVPVDMTEEELWDTYRPKLIVFVRNFGGVCARQPEDVTHEIIAQALAARNRFDGRFAFSTWLYTLARNRCVDVERRERRRRAILERNASQLAQAHNDLPGPEALSQRCAEAAAVDEAVQGLAPRDRQIAFLRYYEELPVADLAEVMSMPEGTVKYRLHRIHRELRRRLLDWESTDE